MSNTKHSRLRDEQERLTKLMNTDPAGAVAAARELDTAAPAWRQLRAVILCDAGVHVKDLAAIEEAVSIFEQLRQLVPESGGLAYNLANALSGQAISDRPDLSDWYLRTAARRHRARSMFGKAAQLLESEDALASQAMVNLGNSLDSAHRWIEAFESYEMARNLRPKNGVASGCAAEMLFRVAQWAPHGHQAHLADLAQRLAHHAQSHSDVVAELAGPSAVARFKKLPSKQGDLSPPPLPKDLSEYARFVAEHRLLLCPILEGPAHGSKRWDDAHIASVSEGSGGGALVPDLFAMFNVMKSDYLAAREILFHALCDSPDETGLYFDTLDYAVYGLSPARLILAQRAALDLLDKIAVALNVYFEVGKKAKKINFHNFWLERQGKPTWHPVLKKAVLAGNFALVALSEIASDLQDRDEVQGLLREEKAARNVGTHGFTVLHDLGIGAHRENAAVEHHELKRYQATALKTMKLSRAALLYFLEAVSLEEGIKATDSKGAMGHLSVYPHHFIRGDDT